MGVLLAVAALLASYFAVIAVRRSRRGRERTWAGYTREAQRFAEHPWRRSLLGAPLAAVIAGFPAARLIAYGHLNSSLAAWLSFGPAIAVLVVWPLFYRFWLGPYLCRKCL